MRIVEPADRILSPISRRCDLPMVSFLPHLKELRFWGMYAGRREASRAEVFWAFRRILGAI